MCNWAAVTQQIDFEHNLHESLTISKLGSYISIYVKRNCIDLCTKLYTYTATTQMNRMNKWYINRRRQHSITHCVTNTVSLFHSFCVNSVAIDLEPVILSHLSTGSPWEAFTSSSSSSNVLKLSLYSTQSRRSTLQASERDTSPASFRQ